MSESITPTRPRLYYLVPTMRRLVMALSALGGNLY
jgi:hypothetical protein